MDSCRVLNGDNPGDIIFVSMVGHAYDPPVYFAEGSDVYADTSNLYGQVILFDAEGKPVIHGNEVVTRFMRVPIAETS